MGRARPPLRPGARLRARRARCSTPARGRRAHPAHRPRPDPRRPASSRATASPRRSARAEAMGRAAAAARRAGVRLDRGDRARASRAGACAASRRRAARSPTDTSSSAPASGARRRRGMLGGVRAPARARPAPVRVHRAAARARRARRARSSTRSCATRTTRCTSASTRDAYGDRQLPPRAAADRARGHPAPGGEMQPSIVPFTPEDFDARRARDAALLPAVARRRARRARSTA